MSTQRLLVRSDKAAAASLNRLHCVRSECRWLVDPALGRLQTLAAGFGFTRSATRWRALHHGEAPAATECWSTFNRRQCTRGQQLTPQATDAPEHRTAHASASNQPDSSPTRHSFLKRAP